MNHISAEKYYEKYIHNILTPVHKFIIPKQYVAMPIQVYCGSLEISD